MLSFSSAEIVEAINSVLDMNIFVNIHILTQLQIDAIIFCVNNNSIVSISTGGGKSIIFQITIYVLSILYNNNNLFCIIIVPLLIIIQEHLTDLNTNSNSILTDIG